MSALYQKLCDVFTRVYRIDHAMTFLNWDQMVMMPAQGLEARSESLAELASLRHGLLSDPELGAWFSELDTLSLSADERPGIREMHRQWQETICLPADLVRAQIVAGSRCEHGWRAQKKDNDWKGFLGNFKEVVELAREEAQLRQVAANGRFTTPYDAMLDLHCAGDTSELISGIFSELKDQLPTLLVSVMELQKSDQRPSIEGRYPIARQQELNERLMTALGFDFTAGRLDVSVHPFSTGVMGDQRITTRFREDEFSDALQATAHETGHASYESGLPPRWATLPVGSSRNMCIHESQSLLFEKQLFMSRPFCEYFTPVIHELLADTKGYDHEAIWLSSTRVRPSYIRVEADEVTYPLHVMLRYDIESALINGDMNAEEVPAVWNEKMKAYLGLDVGDKHSKGCLQDIHWTDGSFGYFPSYTMGAVNSAQLIASLKKQYPDWQERVIQGDIEFVREWLSDNIWRHGSTLESQALIQSATGEGSNASHLLEHLNARYLRREY